MNETQTESLSYFLSPSVEKLVNISSLIADIYGSETLNGFDRLREYDFTDIEWNGELVSWKIDYYHENLGFDNHPLDLGVQPVVIIVLKSER